ncbi:MAG: S46 family peptidase [Gammaproteobacteria bacterium]|nr:S46 family peptidase [Gammaproteobacteria bacterium]
MKRVIASLLAAAFTCSGVVADEGMWTFDNFPSSVVEKSFGARIDGAWLDRVRESTVRLAGCTASFVSNEGLLLTNHHCIASCLAENSSKERSLLEEGFVARGRANEIKCPTQLADILVAMDNVTGKIEAATRGLDDRAANNARKKTLTELEQACEKTSGNKCQSVTLYNGGQYFIYQYKRYTDIRLVFAPEAGIAAFGGDPDNFQFPRWCLDMGLLRAYVNGKPVKPAHHLKMNFEGPRAGEFVLVSGHPGSTDRLLTVAQLQQLREVEFPPSLLRSNELRGRYIQFSKTSDDARRIAEDPLFSLENGIKVRRKQLDALLDDNMMAQKRHDEAELRANVRADKELLSVGDPWTDIEKANAFARNLDMELSYLEGAAGFSSRYFRIARALVRSAAEREKPNTERLREFTDASLPRIRQQLAAAVPIYPELETLTLSFGFERMREWLGPDHPTVRSLLAKDSPDTLAQSLVLNTRLGDPEFRLALWNGGSAGIAASTDPFVQLAQRIDPEARSLRKRYEDEVEAPTSVAEEKIARARFKLYGTNVYPDATFTLRLNYGTVQGWVEKGKPVEPFTRLAMAFERATGQAPFRIPASWEKVRGSLDLSTPVNLSTNNDIVGGNSGSPLLNSRGEVVGLIFDGNIHSISGAYWFDNAKNRSIAVHPAIMREALDKVYRADDLLRELGARE